MNSRHNFRASAKEMSPNGAPLPNNDNGTTNRESSGGNNVAGSSFAMSSVSQVVQHKNLVPARQPKVGTARGGCDGDNTNKVDKERQKAVARELRKMKQRR